MVIETSAWTLWINTWLAIIRLTIHARAPRISAWTWWINTWLAIIRLTIYARTPRISRIDFWVCLSGLYLDYRIPRNNVWVGLFGLYLDYRITRNVVWVGLYGVFLDYRITRNDIWVGLFGLDNRIRSGATLLLLHAHVWGKSLLTWTPISFKRKNPSVIRVVLIWTLNNESELPTYTNYGIWSVWVDILDRLNT